MKKLLIICGPTATGKTRVGLHLAKKLDGELISADSRQIYKHMDVVTGKDLPDNAQYHKSKIKVENLDIGFYLAGGVRIWGYDLVEPDQQFNVSLFRRFASAVISDIYKRRKLPLLVGGTGLYIDSLVKPLDKIDIPKDEKLRNDLSGFSVNELYRLLLRENPNTALSMNPSDRSNPRRLVRAIEISRSDGAAPAVTKKEPNIQFDNIFWIGLTWENRDKFYQIINQRVEQRFSAKFDEEINYLKNNDLLRFAPSKTLGYAQWLKYLRGEMKKEEAIDEWKTAEQQYSKRQFTWFKNNKEIIWFDAGKNNIGEVIEIEVKKWYSSFNEQSPKN